MGEKPFIRIEKNDSNPDNYNVEYIGFSQNNLTPEEVVERVKMFLNLD